MRKPILENVEIKEPPLEELTKTHSGITKACFTGCLFLVFIIIGLIIAIRLFTGPGPQVVKEIPANFPKEIPIYDPDNIHKITFISGKYKNRSIEIAAIFPKIILSPIFLALNDENIPQTEVDKKTSFKDLWKIITTPVGDHRDTVRIEWTDIDSTPNFIYSYYKIELTKKNFVILKETDTDNGQQFSFSNNNGVSGDFLVQDKDGNQPQTEYISLTVNINNQ